MARVDDCAICVAIPLDKPRWLQDITAESGKEYAKFYLQSAGGSFRDAGDVWTKLYEPLEARPISDSLSELGQLGVEVVRDCELRDLSAITETKEVVIVIAHWRSGLLFPEHVRDARQFVRLLSTARSPVLTVLRNGLPSEIRQDLSRMDRDSIVGIPGGLLEALNRAMRRRLIERDELPSPPPFELALNRAALNRECSGVIDTTSGLELSDATHDAGVVARAIWQAFNGTLDLTACFSMVLAEDVKRRVPACLIMANREAVSPAIRVPLIRQTLRVLATQPGDYIETSRAIREHLLS